MSAPELLDPDRERRAPPRLVEVCRERLDCPAVEVETASRVASRGEEEQRPPCGGTQLSSWSRSIARPATEARTTSAVARLSVPESEASDRSSSISQPGGPHVSEL